MISFQLFDPNLGSSQIQFNGSSYIFNYPCVSPSTCTPYFGILPPSKYLFEVWGAQGGNSDYPGGKGGYAKGELTLLDSTTIYITIGGQPTTKTGSTAIYGGYNGGGGCTQDSKGNGGGGGTDVRIGNYDFYSRIIVGGGGGGGPSMVEYPAGAGGGSQGTPSAYGPTTNNGKESSGGTGGAGTQGIFGLGGNHSGSASGGGGGWYGGSGSSNTGCCTGGAGGSGYVLTSSSYKPSGYILGSEYHLNNTLLINGESNIPTVEGSIGIGHSGHGVVRITQLLPSSTPLRTPSQTQIPTPSIFAYCPTFSNHFHQTPLLITLFALLVLPIDNIFLSYAPILLFSNKPI